MKGINIEILQEKYGDMMGKLWKSKLESLLKTPTFLTLVESLSWCRGVVVITTV